MPCLAASLVPCMVGIAAALWGAAAPPWVAAAVAMVFTVGHGGTLPAAVPPAVAAVVAPCAAMLRLPRLPLPTIKTINASKSATALNLENGLFDLIQTSPYTTREKAN